jgi:hypothetical protein
MILTKPATVNVLAHAVALVTDTSQQLPGVNDAYADGARGIIVQNIDLVQSLWLALDGTNAEVDYGIRFEPRSAWTLYLDDVRLVRVIAPANESAKVSVTFLR